MSGIKGSFEAMVVGRLGEQKEEKQNNGQVPMREGRVKMTPMGSKPIGTKESKKGK